MPRQSWFSCLPLAMTLALASASCQRETITHIKVEVRTNQGDPVHEAQVRVGGRILGSTDAKGILEVKPAIIDGSQVAIEITKISDSYYFAPHVETLDLSKSSTRPVVVKAVMYFVPKPKTVEANPPSLTAAAQAAQARPAPTESPATEVLAMVTAPVIAPEKTVLEKLAPEKSEPAKQETPKEEKPSPPQNVLVTFHVFSGNAGLVGVRIGAVPRMGGEGDREGQIEIPEKLLCTTNLRGRCAVRMEPGTEWELRLAKSGYVPETQDLLIDANNKLVRLQMQKGQTMQILAYGRGVTSTVPLQGVLISIDGKPAGTTDKAGRFRFTFKGSPAGKRGIGSTLKVDMAPPKGFLPESCESEFNTDGDIHLARHFVSGHPRLPVAVVEDSRQTSSTLDQATSAGLLKLTDAALDRKVFSRKIMTKVNPGHKHPDLRIRRSFSRHAGGTLLELVAVDAKGIVMAAAKEEISGDASKPEKLAQIQTQIDSVVERLVRSLPFQGVVTAVDQGQIRVLLPGQLAAIVKPGDRFDVFGAQMNVRARKQNIANIASARIPESEMTSAGGAASSDAGAELALVVDEEPSRKTISRGDLVVMRGMPAQSTLTHPVAAEPDAATAKPEAKEASKPPRALKTMSSKDGTSSILVRSRASDDPRPVPQANVYFNDVWIGTSNSNGVVYLPRSLLGTTGKVAVTKAGWNQAMMDATPATGKQIEVTIEAEATRLRVDSVPAGASVFLEGKLSGKTPLDTRLDGAGAFVKLEIAGPDGYKKYATVLEVEAGTLDLTGSRAVHLESDVITNAKKMADAGKTLEAIAALEKVPENHTDFLVSRHIAGELALGKLNDPVKAEQFFASVTAVPEVRDFIDKRFIGAHINEGMAIHMIAEKSSRSNPKAAAEGFGKAAAILDRAAKYTRFLPKKDFKQSVQNLEYFRALSFHRRWLLTNDQSALDNASRAWREYLDNVMPADDLDKQSKILADNARVYLKQTQAGLSRR